MSTIDYREAKKSDDPKTFIEGYAARVAKNAALVAKYPFLLPLDYKGKVPTDYDFSFTELENLPEGWHSLMVDLSDELLDFFKQNKIDPYAFYIDQLKEKFGAIRLYYSLHLDDKFEDERIDEIIQKYEELSEHTCCRCGKEATLMSKGWICPYCQTCADELVAKGGKRWEFAPLERSTWKKIEVGETFGKV